MIKLIDVNEQNWLDVVMPEFTAYPTMSLS